MTAAAAGTELEARAVRAIAIGASAGGIDALRVLLPALPSALAVPVLIVLHISAEAREDRWALVFRNCAFPVREAEDKETAEAGHVYLAPADYHLLVGKEGVLALSADPPVNMSRPSIDVLLESAAWAFGERLLAIVMSGANADGAAGLRAVHAAGGLCWVQHPDEALTVTMPVAAIKAVPTARVLTLAEMAEALEEIVKP